MFPSTWFARFYKHLRSDRFKNIFTYYRLIQGNCTSSFIIQSSSFISCSSFNIHHSSIIHCSVFVSHLSSFVHQSSCIHHSFNHPSFIFYLTFILHPLPIILHPSFTIYPSFFIKYALRSSSKFVLPFSFKFANASFILSA